MPNGRVLAVGGLVRPSKQNRVPEVFDGSRWTPLPNAARDLSVYPFMFLLGSGKVLKAGPSQNNQVLDLANGQWQDTPYDLVNGVDPEDTPAVTWIRLDVNPPVQKILIPGGGANDNSTARNAQIIAFDANGNVVSDRGVAGWRHTGNGMVHPRISHNATILPDGTVLVTGGRTNAGAPVTAAEVFDPADESWREMATMALPRVHHSTAFLLASGQVAVAGGNPVGNVTGNSIETFSPPYLFWGPRPTFKEPPPAQIGYGSATFSVTVYPNDTGIDAVSLIRPSAVTHSFNQDQRYVGLKITHRSRTNDGSVTLQVVRPEKASLAPPGHYMLFAVNSQGVPTEAAWVRVG